MNQLKKSFSVMILCLMLGGCGTPQVITASDTAISIDIENTGMTTSEMIKKGAAIAEEHCKKYGKTANLENTSGFWGAAHIASFNCR